MYQKSCVIEEQVDIHCFSLLRWSWGFRIWSTIWASWENSATLLQTPTYFFVGLLAGFSAVCRKLLGSWFIIYDKFLLPSFESSSNTCWLWPGFWGLRCMFFPRLYIFPGNLLMWLALATYSLVLTLLGRRLPSSPRPLSLPHLIFGSLARTCWRTGGIIAQRSMCPMDLPSFGRDTWAGRIHHWTPPPSVLSCNDLDKCPPGNWWHSVV